MTKKTERPKDLALIDPRDWMLETATQDNKVAILIAVYQNHAATLAAIEKSQQSVLALVLGVYSAGITFIGAKLHDGISLEWPFTIALIVVAGLLAYYGWFMTYWRNAARRSVREGLVQCDHALGLFEKNVYLKNKALYPENWKDFALHSFLDKSNQIIFIAAAAFIIIAIAALYA